MPTSRRRFVDGLRDVAWSQWTELGVAGAFRNHRDVLIDPEALVLFTAALGDLDPRLRDESLDWCIRFGDAISISRLKNLQKELGTEASFSRYAAIVNGSTTLKWPTRGQPAVTVSDPASAATTGKSQAPNLRRPALLRLRLRAIFGVGARADILTELLYGSGKSAAEVAAIGYSKRQVAKILDDLSRAEILSRTKAANTFRFELAKPRELEPLLGRPTTYYAHWVDCFRVLLAVHQLIEEHQSSSDRLKALASNRVFREIVSALGRLRWGVPVSASADTLWQRTVEWAAERAQRAAEGAPDPRNVSFLRVAD
jgi:hypothetical protein